MSRRADRWAEQQRLEADRDRDDRLAQERSPRAIPVDEQCPAALGRRCVFTMRGTDGQFRCWWCCKTEAERARRVRS